MQICCRHLLSQISVHYRERVAYGQETARTPTTDNSLHVHTYQQCKIPVRYCFSDIL